MAWQVVERKKKRKVQAPSVEQLAEAPRAALLPKPRPPPDAREESEYARLLLRRAERGVDMSGACRRGVIVTVITCAYLDFL